MSDPAPCCCHGSARYSLLRCALLGSLSALLFYCLYRGLIQRLDVLDHHRAVAAVICGWLVLLPSLIGICSLSERRLYVLNGVVIQVSRLVLYMVDVRDLSGLIADLAKPDGMPRAIAFRKNGRTCLTIQVNEWRVRDLHAVFEEILLVNPGIEVDPAIFRLGALGDSGYGTSDISD